MAEFKYKGKTEEELKKMPVKEFMEIVPARIRRTLKKGLTPNQKKLLQRVKEDPDKFHRTNSRDMVIIPELIGAKLGIHNGKDYVNVEIKAEMLGHKLGEFVLTRKEVKHSAPGFGATRSSKYVPLK